MTHPSPLAEIIKDHLYCGISADKGYYLCIKQQSANSDETFTLTKPILVAEDTLLAVPHVLPLPWQATKAQTSAIQLSMSIEFKKRLTLEQDFIQLIHWPESLTSWAESYASIQESVKRNSRLGISLGLLHSSNGPDYDNMLQLNTEIPLLSTLFLYKLFYAQIYKGPSSFALDFSSIFADLGLSGEWGQWCDLLPD